MTHDIRKLPQWAQRLTAELEQRNEMLARELEQTQQAAAITCHPRRHWFTIQGPYLPKADPYHLWVLHEDNPHKLCALNHGDVLLVGRKLSDTEAGECND